MDCREVFLLYPGHKPFTAESAGPAETADLAVFSAFPTVCLGLAWDRLSDQCDWREMLVKVYLNGHPAHKGHLRVCIPKSGPKSP